MRDLVRYALCMVLEFVVLWYMGAMLNFFPFLGDDLALRAVGYTGFLVTVFLAVSTCWIIWEIRKKK